MCGWLNEHRKRFTEEESSQQESEVGGNLF